MPVSLVVDGREVEVPDDGSSLLEVLRDRLGLRSAKDGCSPQGQCGCCTVWIDGAPRVACVTPARRVAGRSVTTLDGLDPGSRQRWAEAFSATGASQCGFCTPGIVMRLAALEARAEGSVDEPAVGRALAAHLCRCTGWRTIVDAARLADSWRAGTTGAAVSRDVAAAAHRAALEGGTPQTVDVSVPLGAGGFADDTAPADALVAVPDGEGGWAVAETLRDARAAAGKVQGRRSTIPLGHPLEVPPGPWQQTLRTTWVEPAYLETDASWCRPGGEPASPLANGGAFGAKLASPAPDVARRLADEHGRPVRVLLSREDTVRMGPKRPPVAAGIGLDGTGLMRIVRTPGVADVIRSVAPGIVVEEVDVAGPQTSGAVRGAGWVEAAVLLAALAHLRDDSGPEGGSAVRVALASGATAEASIAPDGGVGVRVSCGPPLDDVVLRSYCTGAAHMALSWVRSEGLAVDEEGHPLDLTIRSFGILAARDMPTVDVEIARSEGSAVNGSDAVFAAVAAAAWIADGLPQDWPTGGPERRR
ncbi:MAG TPA: 2Fe-2S iron-sulfur cluster-binding protein [Acidimicrobiales bacterium]|nr:2Fe-2S iron-sulfur cluster-binding protein [Acidimicrobiales bacterium]